MSMSLVAAILIAAVLVRWTYYYWQRHDLDGWGFTRAKFRIWLAKGMVLPTLLWMAINAGLSPRFPPLLFAIHAAKAGGGNWLPDWLALATPTVSVVGSYWTAATLVWLLALHIVELECDLRELAGGMIAWTLLLSPVAVFIVHLTGLTGVGWAVALLLAPVLSELLALGNPRKRRIYPVYSRALEKIKAGKYSAAEKEVIRQLEKCETDFAGWMLLAELYAFQFGDLQEAERLVHEVCRQPETTRAQMSDALHRLADWQLKAGADKAAAIRSLELICEAFPGTHYGDVARQRIDRLQCPS